MQRERSGDLDAASSGPDLTPHVREWFRGHGFEEEHFDAPDHAAYSVGVHRFVGEPKPLDADQRLFTFIKLPRGCYPLTQRCPVLRSNRPGLR